MIITKQKPIEELIDTLRGYAKIFLIGCGDCAADCRTGGKDELVKMQGELEKQGKNVLGVLCPEVTCSAAKLKMELAKNISLLKQADAVLVLACGLGVQSVKDNDRFGLAVFTGCDTLCAALSDGKGNFFEKCSMCGDCILSLTEGICPVTLCPKGILNGPCGGMDKEKCEVDRDKDCAWVLIYKEMAKKNKLDAFKLTKPARNFNKITKPQRILNK